MRRIAIRPEFSAVASNTGEPSRAVRAALEVLTAAGAARICEIGCGLMANTVHFLRTFPFVIVTDRKEQKARISSRMSEFAASYRSFRGFVDKTAFGKMRLGLDAAVVINVLHILPTPAERIDCLTSARRNLRKGGIVFADVPYNVTYYRGLLKNFIHYRDGYAINRNGFHTFYKNISLEEAKEYFHAARLDFVSRIPIDHRVTLVGQSA